MLFENLYEFTKLSFQKARNMLTIALFTLRLICICPVMKHNYSSLKWFLSTFIQESYFWTHVVLASTHIIFRKV
jgi:hypothetical protein